MILEILSTLLAALAALGPTEGVIAGSALAFDVAALVAIRHFLGARRTIATRRDDADFREAA